MLGPGFQVDPPSGRGQQFESMIAAYSMMVNISSLFALFIGMFIIYNAFAIAVTQRRTEIGIMRLVGASRWYTQLPFLVEAILAATVGVLIAIIGLLVVRWMFLDDALSQFYQANLIARLDYADIIYVAPWLLLLGAAMAGLTSYATLRLYVRR